MYKVLLIGLGAVGMGYDFDTTDAGVMSTHARAFSNHPDFQLACAVDPDPGARARFQERYGGWVVADLAEGLRTACPDVVVVASPTRYHAEAVQMVLRHAKPKLILCEKPLSYSLEEARAVVTACSDAGCLLYVNYMRRVEPGALEIRRRLQTGAIASPLKGVVWYTKGLLHNGSHFFNLLEFWLGPMANFRVIKAGSPFGEADIEPDVQVCFSAGEVIFLAARENHFSHHEIQLVAPNGCLRYQQGGRQILWQAACRDPDFRECKVLTLPGEGIVTKISKLQLHVTNQVSACLRGQVSSLCSGDDALQTLESLLKIKAAL